MKVSSVSSPLVRDDLEPLRRRLLLREVSETRAPHRGVEYHTQRLHAGRVRPRVRNRPVLIAHPRPAPRDAPRAHARERHGDDVPPVQRHDPAHGAGEARAGRLPLHRLGKLQPRDEGGQLGGENGGRTAAREPLAHAQVLALLRLDPLEAVDRNSLRARETLRRGGRLPVGQERTRHRRTGENLLARLLAVREPPHGQHQPARRGGCVNLSVNETVARQYGARVLPQLFRRGRQIGRRYVLGADLQDEGAHAPLRFAARPPAGLSSGNPRASRFSMYATAARRASARMRPM